MIELKSHIILGIAGRHEAGKTTTAKYFLRNFGTLGECNWIHEECGNEIVKCVAEILNIDYHSILAVKTNPIIRAMLETVGASYQKLYGRSVITTHLNSLLDIKPSIIIVSGIRLPDEAQWIRANNGRLIIVRRPRLDDKGKVINEEILPTETMLEQIGYHYAIDNHGSLQQLSLAIRYLFDDIVRSDWFESKTTAEP